MTSGLPSRKLVSLLLLAGLWATLLSVATSGPASAREPGPDQTGTSPATGAVSTLPAAVAFRRVQTKQPYVAVTVDDFISRDYSLRTPIKILSAANEMGAPLTLFPTGGALTIYLEKYPDQAAQIEALYAAGSFELGDHTWSHPYLDRLSLQSQLSEISRGKQGVSTFFGVGPDPVMRPPFGHWNKATLQAAYQAGFRYVALWSIDSRDSVGPEKPAAQLIAAANCAAPGDVILFHANRASSAEAIPQVISRLRAKGLEPVTLSTLLASGTPTMSDLPYSQRAPWCRKQASSGR